ncbi:hypothetical protein THUN1379_24710 [Paludibacterium sp. THUN1379]|uniref:caspase family protein n=1 Tax=Paludibacterium sp. THUN1379 TaxID=3112107 RepID=UPI0030920D3F|nr:hypothetical protein THUN1379_24710 [Paludibacterium sp. THUN1379]
MVMEMARFSRFFCLLLIFWITTCRAAGISTEDLNDIRAAFQTQGLTQATVGLDDLGRVILKGHYEDRREVQKAFSIAQSIVGVSHVAPTTPEDIHYRIDPEQWKQLMERALYLSHTPGAIPGRAPAQKYGLVIGVQRFANSKVPQLTYPAKDAQDFANYLVATRGGHFTRANVQLMLNEQATLRNIDTALTQLERKVHPGDTVVVFISSHGAPPNDQGNMNVITYDTVITPREQIFYTSLSDTRIQSFISAMKGVQLLFILDTCYSGAAFSKLPGFMASGAKDLFVEEEQTATASPSLSNLQYLGKQHTTVDANASKDLTLLLTASSAAEKSWESNQLQNGVFTHYLIEGLQQTGEVNAAFQYARPKVEKQVEQEKSATQTPQILALPQQQSLYLNN